MTLALTLGYTSAFAQQPADTRTTPATPDEARRSEIDERTLRFDSSDRQPQNDTEPQVRAFGVGDILRMLLVLVLVATAIYGVVVLLRRRLPGARAEPQDGPLRVLASRDLSPGRQLHAVMVGKRVYLVGDAEGGVTLLEAIEDRETIDELVLARSAASPARRSFGAVLGQWLSAPALLQRGTPRSETPPGASSLKGQAYRLRQLR